MKILFSVVEQLGARILARVRKVARHVIDEKRREAQAAVQNTPEVRVESTDRGEEFFGFNVRLSQAITRGAAPWDIKPGLLAKTKKHVKKGKHKGEPYVDVPVNMSRLANKPETISLLAAWSTPGFVVNPKRGSGPILFRRVSLRSPIWSWIHPGFGGAGKQSAPRQFGTRFGPGKGIIPGNPDDEDEQMRARLSKVADGIRPSFDDELKKGGG